MALRSGINAPAVLIEKYINSAYDNVKAVADVIGDVETVGEYLADPETDENITLVANAISGNLLPSTLTGVTTTTQVIDIAIEGQTVVGVDNYLTGVGNINVHLNGVYQAPGTAYTESSVNTITFSEPLSIGDQVVVVRGNLINNVTVTLEVDNEVFTINVADTTELVLTDLQYVYNSNNVNVYVNGSKQLLGEAYTEDIDGKTITFTTGLNVGDKVEIVVGNLASNVPYDIAGINETLANHESDTGSSYIGYTPAGTGAVPTTVESKLREFVSAADYGADPTGATDNTAIFQALIDLQTTVVLAKGNYRCDGSLFWKSGAKFVSNGDEYITGTPDPYRTRIVFNADLTSSGIVFAPAAGQWIKNWAIEGIVFDTTRTASAYSTFKMFDVQDAAGGGVFQFRLKDVTVQHCFNAFYVDDGMFSYEMQNVSVSYCVQGLVKTVNNFMTSSDTHWLKFFHVFDPIAVNNITYMDFACFFDFCGLQAAIPIPPAYMTDRMPVLFRGNSAQDVTFTQFGVENSNAMLFRLENYSTVSANVSYYQPTTEVWQKSATRIIGIPEAQQALFSLSSAWLKVINMRSIFSAENGYPAVGTSKFAHFEGDASTRLTISNSIINMRPYIVCNSGFESYLSAPLLFNGDIRFGDNLNWRQDFNYVNGYVVAGSTSTPDYHFFQRNRTFVQGEEAFRVTGATAASAALRLFAVNGAGGNVANSAVKVSTDSVTGRSINAGGTVNASGTDYAEYEFNNGLTISKGSIVGFKADGTLTLTFSEAVRFGIKSTNPSYVGGDTWGDEDVVGERPERHGFETDDAYREAVTAWEVRVEAERVKVDRVAYSGKVPVNVTGAAPGQYIVVIENPDGSIGGEAVATPSFEQYCNVVGRVNKVLDDGRAEVAVIIH